MLPGRKQQAAAIAGLVPRQGRAGAVPPEKNELSSRAGFCRAADPAAVAGRSDRRFWRGCMVQMDGLNLHGGSLGPQRVDRVQSRCAASRQDAREQANGDGEAFGQQDKADRGMHGQRRYGEMNQLRQPETQH